LQRLGTHASSGSGGWRTKSRSSTLLDSDEEDGAEGFRKHLEPGENEHIVVTPPAKAERRPTLVDGRANAGAPSPLPARSSLEKGKEREKEEEKPKAKVNWKAEAPRAGHTLRHEHNEGAPEPLEAHVPREVHEHADSARRSTDSVGTQRSVDEELAMPGSFYGSTGSRQHRHRSGSQRSHRSHQNHHGHHHYHPDGLLAGFFRKMHLS